MDGTVITYGYDAMGAKLTMKHYAPGNSTPVITDYVGGFVYENGELRFFGSPEGRVVKNGSNFEYQYAIADHQGNTRVVFSSATPSVETPTTGFESDPGDLENYPSGGNLSDLPLFNQTPGGTHSQLLNGGYSSQVGIAKSFKVYPGDKVKIQAYAKYEDVPGPGNAQGFATALLQAFSLPSPAAGEAGTPSSALDTWGTLVDTGVQDDETAPQAFVNIVIFDKNFDFLDAAWTQINASAKQVGVSPDVPHDELIQEYSIDEEGYVFMYVSNNSPLKVYFDDVTFTYTPTNVIQYNEYYPFGLQTSNSWTRDNNRNDYLYNAGSELNATSGWYETFFRGYDPALGRFLQVDPLATKYASQTPYNYAVNNPVMLNDPSGGDALPDGTPDWVDYRMEMIRRYMNGGTGVTELQRRRSQQRWSENAMSLETFLAAAVPSGSHGGYWHDGSGLLYRYDNEVNQYFKFQEYYEGIDRGSNWYGVEDGIPVGRYGWTVGIRLVAKQTPQADQVLGQQLEDGPNWLQTIGAINGIFQMGTEIAVNGPKPKYTGLGTGLR